MTDGTLVGPTSGVRYAGGRGGCVGVGGSGSGVFVAATRSLTVAGLVTTQGLVRRKRLVAHAALEDKLLVRGRRRCSSRWSRRLLSL